MTRARERHPGSGNSPREGSANAIRERGEADTALSLGTSTAVVHKQARSNALIRAFEEPYEASSSQNWARRLLWVAVFTPFIYAAAKTSTQVEAGGLTALDAIRGAGALALLVLALLLGRSVRRYLGFVELSLASFCFVLACSSIWSISPQATLLKSVALIVAYIVILVVVRYYPTVDLAIVAFISIVHLLLLSTAVQAILFPSAVLLKGQEDTTARLTSAVPQISANTLGYVCIVGLAALALQTGPPWASSNLGRICLGSVYGAELLATRTRLALVIGAIVALGALTVIARRQFVAVLHVLLISIFATAVAVGFFGNVLSGYFSRGQTGSSIASLTGRTDIWNVAWRAVGEQPWLGLGFYAGHRLGLPNLATYETQSNIDNTWLELLVDVGVVGTLPAAVYVISAIYRAVRSTHGSNRTKLFVLIVLSYGLIASFVNPTIQTNGINFVIFVYFSLVYPPQSVGFTRLQRESLSRGVGCA